MWQRFTERSRRVVFFAQEEAGRLGENYVSTEHLLLGMTREDDSVAARILERMGVPLARVRSEIERQVERGDGRLGQDMQLTPRAKRVIDLAYDEARELNNNYIGTEHLLLGLIREAEGLAGRVLTKLGVSLEAAREHVTHIQDEREKNEGEDAVRSIHENLSRRVQEVHRTIDALQDGDCGDLGVVQADGRTNVEVAQDASNLVRLVHIFQAKDAHGYREMMQGDQTGFLIASGTPVKILVPPPGTQAAALHNGYYVRVLSGDFEGYAGWIFKDSFACTGADDAPFPPEEEQ